MDRRLAKDDADGFEREVRRIADALYPDEGSGARIVDGRERDGIFVTEDTVVLIEATTSAEKSKAETDGRKLKALSDQMARKYPYKAVKAFFVTKTDPTAHQVEAIRKIGSPVIAVSYAKFRSRLIDGRAYMDARADHAFGSARDPETDDVKVQDSYVSLDFVDVGDRGKQYNITSIIESLEEGRRIVLIGEYGSGKSMTLREIYLHYRRLHFKRDDTRFCLHLNLNDHQGQSDPVEALMRHAMVIGFPQPHQLVRAWRSGEAHVILDGFDEVFAPGWASGSRPLIDVRRRSVELVWRFMKDTPQSSGIITAGREHFFDDLKEMKSHLGLPSNAVIASATDFTEEQVQQYLRNREWQAALPEWLPRRPLIIGYLAGRRLFAIAEDLAYSDPGQGWHRLLAAICTREARADAGIDDIAVRAIVERLASLARRRSNGLGPLEFQDLVTVFRDLRGYLPDEGAYSILQRLPGLRVNDSQTNTRMFIDDDFVDAARAGDLHRWLLDPDPKKISEAFLNWTNLLGATGMAVLRCQVEESGLDSPSVKTALSRLSRAQGTDGMQADLIRLLFTMGTSPSSHMTVANLHVPSVYLAETCDASNVTFVGCLIDSLDLSDVEGAQHLPSLSRCSIDVIEGVTGIDELAAERITDCDIGSFTDSTENMAAILRLDLSDHTTMMLTILRKIFVQSGRSRKESALYRGSLTMAQRELIPDVVKRLQSEGVIRKSRQKDTTHWEANRTMRRRVTSILDSPTTSRDQLLTW